MNPVQVDTAISKASRLMNEGYMGLLDNIAAQNSGKPGKRGVNDLAYLEQQAFGYGAKPSTVTYTPPVQQTAPQRQFSNSALQESFAKTPPISGNNFPGAESMGMTASGYQPGASLLTEQRAQQQFVQPQQVYQPQPQYIPQQVNGIDYNTIKYLVSEAIKENLAELKQSMLTESSLRGISMPGGNKIQFLDSKGNVYEGQLILKKKKQ